MLALQLDPSLPVVTPRGSGEAVGWIIYGKEDFLMWVVLLDDTGECWTFENRDIRGHPHYTLGRMIGRRVADVVADTKAAFEKRIKPN